MAMNPLTKSSWWHNATTEQRLAQIDGGIECGMTGREVALCSGATPGAVHAFAIKHGRRFPLSHKGGDASHKRTYRIRRNRSAYLRGEPIDLWGNTEAQEEFLDEREGA